MDDNPIIRFPHPQQHAGPPTTDTVPARHDPAVPQGEQELLSAFLADSPLRSQPCLFLRCRS